MPKAESAANADKATKELPGAAMLWGWAGVIPFAFLAGASVLAEPGWAALALGKLAIYGAIILTFMGGVHWGLAIAGSRPGLQLFTTGIIPSLIAVCSILVPVKPAIAILIAGFLLLLANDLWLVRQSFFPHWYGRLRTQLTSSVIILLALAGIAG